MMQESSTKTIATSITSPSPTERPCPSCGRCPHCGHVPNANSWWRYPYYQQPRVWYTSGAGQASDNINWSHAYHNKLA